MENKIEIKRCDGIEYERKSKVKNYDTVINMRISSETVKDLKEIATRYGTKYNTMVREILEDYVEREKIKDDTK